VASPRPESCVLPLPSNPHRIRRRWRQNFLLSVFDAQYSSRLQHEDGSHSTLGVIDMVANRVFTAVFALELFLNIYANWPERFLRSGWNWLDCGIVGMSLITDLGSFPDWRVRPVPPPPTDSEGRTGGCCCPLTAPARSRHSPCLQPLLFAAFKFARRPFPATPRSLIHTSTPLP
jgi:hypothetical protein